MNDQIRQVIREHGHLAVDLDTLADDADLYQAGMTSHASVNVMIALEDTFDIEFLDSMLQAQRLRERRLDRRRACKRWGSRHERHGRRRRRAPGRDRAGSPTRSPRPTRSRSTARHASRPRRSPRCARRARCRRWSRTSWAARAPRSRPSPRAASSWAAAAPPRRWSSRCTRSRLPAWSTTAPATSGSTSTCARWSPSSALIASITSEVGTGGDMGKSVAAVSEAGTDGYASFEKQAPTVSYGPYADAFLTTVRRSPEAEPGDQVAVLTRARPDGDAAAGDLGSARDARHLLARLHRHAPASPPTRSCRRRSRRSRRRR